MNTISIAAHMRRSTKRVHLDARHWLPQAALSLLVLLPSSPIMAEDAPISLKIRNHQFIPAQIDIPAGEKRQLLIENEDPTAEEFESHSLHREKIVPPMSRINLFIGPLKPGRYEFIGEFNEATAKGVVVAK